MSCRQQEDGLVPPDREGVVKLHTWVAITLGLVGGVGALPANADSLFQRFSVPGVTGRVGKAKPPTAETLTVMTKAQRFVLYRQFIADSGADMNGMWETLERTIDEASTDPNMRELLMQVAATQLGPSFEALDAAMAGAEASVRGSNLLETKDQMEVLRLLKRLRATWRFNMAILNSGGS
jgi:hypothetical protein